MQAATTARQAVERPSRVRVELAWMRDVRTRLTVAVLAALLCTTWMAGSSGRTVAGAESPVISGPRVVWQPMTIDFWGPEATQQASAPNPFLDYRLTVRFQGPAGQTYSVPGYFDGDGQGGPSGSVWRARFSPDQAGQWTFRASFRAGADVAVSPDPNAGTPAAFDGATGTVTIAARDAGAPGFLKWGRLEYADHHYLKFRDGPYWIKTGANSPENLLGYSGFPNTTNARHTYAPHMRDWRPGDPVLKAGSADNGKGLIGVLNYLSTQGINSVYFMPMNVGGDGRDTWPFAGNIRPEGAATNDNRHYDLAKLSAWETTFAHAQRVGIALHVVLMEAEQANKLELDSATLGVERKLFYRELIARFGHHNALIWNISEEYDHQYPLSADSVKEFAQYIQDLDPYSHPVTVHQWNNPDTAWAPFVGDRRFTLTALQYPNSVARHGDEVEEWRARTAASGHPIPISLDEVRSSTATNAEAQRKEILWPTLLSGGTLEWYIGGQDQSLEDFRTYEPLWTYTRHARTFVEALPFWEMTPDDSLVSGATTVSGGAQVLAKLGDVYGVYLPATTANERLRLPPGAYEQRWYDPRTGVWAGGTQSLSSGGDIAIGPPPSRPTDDWALVVRRTGGSSTPTPVPTSLVTFTPIATASPSSESPSISGFAGVSDGQFVSGTLAVQAIAQGRDIEQVEFQLDGPRAASWTETAAPYYFQGNTEGRPRGWNTRQYPDGTYTLTATVTDRSGRSSARSVRFRVQNSSEATPTPTRTATATRAGGPEVTAFIGVRDGESVRGLVEIRAEASGTAIQHVDFRLTGPVTLTGRETVAPYYFRGDRNGVAYGWDTRDVPDGTYELTATATDQAGRTASKSVRFRVDNDQ
jgi:hypothetical protein